MKFMFMRREHFIVKQKTDLPNEEEFEFAVKVSLFEFIRVLVSVANYLSDNIDGWEILVLTKAQAEYCCEYLNGIIFDLVKDTSVLNLWINHIRKHIEDLDLTLSLQEDYRSTKEIRIFTFKFDKIDMSKCNRIQIRFIGEMLLILLCFLPQSSKKMQWTAHMDDEFGAGLICRTDLTQCI